MLRAPFRPFLVPALAALALARPCAARAAAEAADSEDCPPIAYTIDFDGDGRPDSIAYIGEWPDVAVTVTSPEGRELWRWRLDRETICRDCATDWYWFLAAYDDADRSVPGKEALLQWYDFRSDTGGVTVVSPSRGTVLANYRNAFVQQVCGAPETRPEARAFKILFATPADAAPAPRAAGARSRHG